MPAKVRKQIYLDADQERLLRRLSGNTGLAEAEIIRRALDQHLDGLERAARREKAWREARGFIEKWMRKPAAPGGRSWKRAGLYER